MAKEYSNNDYERIRVASFITYLLSLNSKPEARSEEVDNVRRLITAKDLAGLSDCAKWCELFNRAKQKVAEGMATVEQEKQFYILSAYLNEEGKFVPWKYTSGMTMKFKELPDGESFCRLFQYCGGNYRYFYTKFYPPTYGEKAKARLCIKGDINGDKLGEEIQVDSEEEIFYIERFH